MALTTFVFLENEKLGGTTILGAGSALASLSLASFKSASEMEENEREEEEEAEEAEEANKEKREEDEERDVVKRERAGRESSRRIAFCCLSR
jgi:hypothetical protein